MNSGLNKTMNKSYVLRSEDAVHNWHVVDASGQILGRLSTQIAELLRGKGKPEYTPHTDNGDYVVVVNCDKIKLTGDKWRSKMYERFSGYRSGLKLTAARDVFAKDPRRLIFLAVKRMLPKNRQSREIFRRLRIYVGGQHPHEAQATTFIAK